MSVVLVVLDSQFIFSYFFGLSSVIYHSSLFFSSSVGIISICSIIFSDSVINIIISIILLLLLFLSFLLIFSCFEWLPLLFPILYLFLFILFFSTIFLVIFSYY